MAAGISDRLYEWKKLDAKGKEKQPYAVAMSDNGPMVMAGLWAKWLGEEPATEEELLALLKPCPDDMIKTWQVDKRVGNVRNKGPELAMAI